MTKKSIKPKGDRVGNAFSRFPMLMIKIIKSLEQNDNDTTLKIFLETLGVSENWFKETCAKSKIFNTFPLDQIEIFEFYTEKSVNRLIDRIKLTPKENWESHYNEALEKVLRV